MKIQFLAAVYFCVHAVLIRSVIAISLERFMAVLTELEKFDQLLLLVAVLTCHSRSFCA